jgi:hypothetical protein
MITAINAKMQQAIFWFEDKLKLNLNILITLCIVAQHSFIVKWFGILLLVLFNFQALKKFDYKRIPGFYILITIIEILKFVFLNESYSIPHLAQFSVGISYWIASIALCWLIYYTVMNQKNIDRTIQLITILNFIFSFYQYLRICLIEGTINPFNTGHNHPYGISTGDLISGLFHGVHLTNAFVSLFLIFFHLHRRRFLLVLLALFCLLLTGNNYATLVFFLCSAIYFITDRTRYNFLHIFYTIIITFVFYIFATPLNAEYMLEKVLHISATLPNSGKDISKEYAEQEQDYQVINLPDTLHPYDAEGATSKKLVIKRSESGDTIFDFVKQSGKIRSYYQTKHFLLSSPRTFLFGSGMGGFSSKLAFNSSGVMEGSALSKHLPKYETLAFSQNHKALYSYLKTQHIMFHSESNRPFSVYNQLLGEYGIIGFVLFLVLYVWFFFKRIRKNTFALPVFISMLLIFNIDYFIEALSILLFFETFMFMDIKENQALNEL